MPSTGSPATPGVHDVAAVVVTYRPEVAATALLVRSLVPQVGQVVVVDNGSGAEAVEALRALARATSTDETMVEVVALPSNLGIGAAQNRGVDRVRELGQTHVLLCDQDSIAPTGMVAGLLGGLARAEQHGPVAAVGPVPEDERAPGAPLVFADRRWGPRRADLPDDRRGALVPAAFLIASGCLVPLAVLDRVGGMNEAWFIDHIDLEWGLRARRAGLSLVIVADVSLHHQLGDATRRLPGRARSVHLHSPVRNYYMVRNTLLLVRSGLLPGAWRVGYLAWITKYAGFYALCESPRWRRARLMLRAVGHAAARRTGPLAGS